MNSTFDILMIFPRSSGSSPQKNPAISVFYPGESAVQKGFSVNYWDERFDSFEDLKEKARKAKVFGVSSISGYQLGKAISLMKWCKEQYPEKPIIMGGVHVTFLPENSLQENFVDYVVLGEGEKRLPLLLEAIYCGNGMKKLKEIDGIGYKKDGHVIVNQRQNVVDLENLNFSLVSSRTEKYFKIAAKDNGVILPSSRGCPWANRQRSCTFCSVKEQYIGTYRVVPFEKWAEDIDRIYAVNPFTLIELEDENSAHFIKNLNQYGAHLKNKGIKFHLHLRADQLTDAAKVEEIKEMGCARIHIGVESGNHRVRNEIYKKGENKRHFYEAAKNLAKYDIEGIYSYVIGAPTETRKEMIETFELSDELRKIHPNGKSRSTTYVLMALPGTEIFDLAKKTGWKIPQTMAEWSKSSAAYNPVHPPEINNVYFIAGLHHNRYHKTAQNFPGLWRLLIAPFEFLAEIRWQLKFFKFFKVEKNLIERLITSRNK